MFQEEVVTGNGITKVICADNELELAEGVAAAKAEKSEVDVDINVPLNAEEAVVDLPKRDAKGHFVKKS